jgi:glycosidase
MNFSLKDIKKHISILTISTLSGILTLPFDSYSQQNIIERVDPPNWWVGMETDTIELLVMGANIAEYEISTSEKFIKIAQQENAKNKCYKYVALVIEKGQAAGEVELSLIKKGNKKPSKFKYPLLNRSGFKPAGLNQADNMYLVFPDRFANGDPSNDNMEGMLEKADRSALKGRHGGDLKGIENHLDFIENMGFTAIWYNPILENNQPYESYHGYAATDSYKVDPRLGTNEQFKALSKKLHNKGIKTVWDVVYNHWGNEHYAFKNLPDSNWVHWFSEFTRTNYRTELLMDPYASERDKKILKDGWFDKHMPDLNQQDPHLAKYLIQNSIWWIEYAEIDAFRIDTYPYPDQKFMSDLNKALKKEYPSLHIFGETWVQGSPVQAWFTKENNLNKEFDSQLDGVTDFQLYFAITKGLNEKFGWEEGLRRIQMTLTHDYLYKNASDGVTFLDNHDLGRFFSMVGEDFSKWKMGMSLLATLRGIPCVYYGNEILMTGFTNPDALVRKDFPGGWPGDTLNLFDVNNMSAQQKEALSFSSKLFNWRKQNSWIAQSSFVQYVPEDDTYVYFRLGKNNEKLMCIHSTASKETVLSLNRFEEHIKSSKSGIDIISGKQVELGKTINLQPMSSVMIELR